MIMVWFLIVGLFAALWGSCVYLITKDKPLAIAHAFVCILSATVTKFLF